MNLIKTPPPITIEAARDAYSMRFVIRHRRAMGKMQPEQQAVIMRAGAEQLRTWAEQMESEAALLVDGESTR